MPNIKDLKNDYLESFEMSAAQELIMVLEDHYRILYQNIIEKLPESYHQDFGESLFEMYLLTLHILTTSPYHLEKERHKEWMNKFLDFMCISMGEELENE